mgnify:CR=1 FL=1
MNCDSQILSRKIIGWYIELINVVTDIFLVTDTSFLQYLSSNFTFFQKCLKTIKNVANIVWKRLFWQPKLKDTETDTAAYTWFSKRIYVKWLTHTGLFLHVSGRTIIWINDTLEKLKMDEAQCRILLYNLTGEINSVNAIFPQLKVNKSSSKTSSTNFWMNNLV